MPPPKTCETGKNFRAWHDARYKRIQRKVKDNEEGTDKSEEGRTGEEGRAQNQNDRPTEHCANHSAEIRYEALDVVSIIEEEQKLTMEYARMGYKVIKKNYLTIESKRFEGKKDWVCPLDGKKYTLEPKTRVLVRVGVGFKRYISDKQMPDKLCRFVGGAIPANAQG